MKAKRGVMATKRLSHRVEQSCTCVSCEETRGLARSVSDRFAEIDALKAKLADAERRAARAEALVTQWHKDVADYPSATDHDAYVASVSVSMCADELAKALADPKNGALVMTTSSPTIPSTDGVLDYERLDGDALVQAIRLAPGEHLLVRRPWRWHLDGVMIPNAYESFSRDGLCRDKGWEVVCDFGEHIAVVRKVAS